MESYFDEVSCNLTFDDLIILTILSDKEANTVFKSIDYLNISEESKLTTFQMKKSIQRLGALKFIKVSLIGKKRQVSITEYGYLALNKNLKGAEEQCLDF